MSKETLKKLQQPTMALIGSFYPMDEDVKSFFTDMLSIYEQNPTQETANMLFDKVMGKETPEEKKMWIREKASLVPLPLRQKTAERYIDHQESVPKGVPTSGNVLVGLNVVSRADKEALMEAQAAARILNHLVHPEEVRLTNELFSKDADGRLSEARPYLDKPFSTKIQRLEHLSAILAGYDIIQRPYAEVQKKVGDTFGYVCPEIKEAKKELEEAAVSTLYRVAKCLSPSSGKVAEEIRDLAKSYPWEETGKEYSTKEITRTMTDILPPLFLWHAPHLNKGKVNLCEDSYTPEERTLAEGLIKKRIKQIQENPETLSHRRTQAEK